MAGRLSQPIDDLADQYDVVVVGSGYGGSIAASRLARATKTVCVLERGDEKQPGEYPEDELAMLGEVQFDSPHAHYGSSTALFDVRYNDDINVIVGCGLGGTSLINAGICIRPAGQALTGNDNWPAELQVPGVLDPYFGMAEDMLRASPTPSAYMNSRKTSALREAARGLGTDIAPVPLLVNFESLPRDLNHVGVRQLPCVGCGNCISGCNYHAKNTLIMNYLPDAKNHHAQIFTRTRITHIQRRPDGWRVLGRSLREDGRVRPLSVSAQVVVLAGGTLGTTEILLRSKEMGLPLSRRVGSRFSGNGDTIGFAYNTDHRVNGLGQRDRRPEPTHPTGPCSTAIIDLRAGGVPGRGMVMADGAIPGAVAGVIAPALAVEAHLKGVAADRSLWHKLKGRLREVASTLRGPYTGASRNTLFLLLIGHDASKGRMYLDDDRLRVSWPGLGEQEQFASASELLERATHALGGTYIPNPVWNDLTDQNLVTGHPLGGCPMASNARQGVVNHKGQVFDCEEGDSVHAGLYVMDGSVVPTALGVNPLLTISALAERSCHHLARDHGWESTTP
jgi:cholesterol oxidase